MISLEDLLKYENTKNVLEHYDIENVDKWLFETYYDRIESGDHISENQFYHNKYNFVANDAPQYWMWQRCLYERLDTSISVNSSMFGSLFKPISGIDEVIIDNDWCIGFITNDSFNESSNEFERLLDFGNYFIKSKRNSDGSLPNPFFIEARKPKELISYRYEYAYHVTNKYAYEKIKKYGLCPKSKSFIANYDDRIYMFISDNVNTNDLKYFGRISLRLWKMSIDNNDKHNMHDIIDIDKDVVILKIDLKKFEEDHKKQMKLFGDPSYNKKSAVFTLESIPTKYIEKL